MAKKDGQASYKDTVNLPQTDFDMRAGLVTKEPQWLAAWAKQDLYGQVRRARAGSPRYVLHDGPPYANGDIHMGHLLNKVLKDVVVRYKTMTGHDAPYIPGWDCHGLPIEAKVMEELGRSAGQMDRMEIRRKCQAYAAHYIEVQKQQFQRLGIWGEFDKPYSTMDGAYEADVLEVFARMVAEGVVYRQLKPVHWSIENRTALADAELEYYDRQDTSIYVLFALAEGQEALARALGLKEPAGELALMIWTTTPWTLPANLAVAVHPDFEYTAARFASPASPDKKRYAIVAKELAGRVFAAAGVKEYELIGTVAGHRLAELKLSYAHPLIADKRCPVVTANYVTLEDGTGLVHTAPGHGLEDYGTAIRTGLEVYCPVQADGTFDDTAPEFLRGKVVWEANDLVCRRLTEAGAMFHQEKFTHSYPHDWRSKKPTIFRATEQWFIAVDEPLRTTSRTLRDLAMDVVAEKSPVQFVPAWGRNRLAGMLESRPDWCISRQRAWGLPIPAFVNPHGQVLLTPASVRAVADHFREHGSDSWFTATPSELLAKWDRKADTGYESHADFTPAADDAFSKAVDKGVYGPEFDPATLEKQMDIFDVWFESGSSWHAVAEARKLVERIPVDLYLEGSDQHRGWFQLSLLPGLAAGGRCPFSAVLTHGFVVDEQGYKMSKSTGNAVNVQDELSKRGADVMRLWVASVNYQDDVRTSDKLIAQIEDAYRKIRNTLRFAMGSCFDFSPEHHNIQPAEHSVDRWMALELDRLTRQVLDAYEAFEFHKVYRLIYEFCTTQASSIYMAAVKDRLYCELPHSPRRRASQTMLHRMLMTLTKLLAPILPFTAQEAWEFIPNRPADEPASVHLALMPVLATDAVDQAFEVRPELRDAANWTADLLQDGPAVIWQRLLAIRDEALVKLEALRATGVKNPLDAEMVFHVAADDEAHRRLIELYLSELEDLLGVGFARLEADLAAGSHAVEYQALDTREKYKRCERSWKRRPDVGSDAKYPDLSARDAKVVRALKQGSR